MSYIALKVKMSNYLKERRVKYEMGPLPAELVEHILSRADGRTFLTCRLVCRHWMNIADRIAQKPDLWKSFCEREYKCSYKSAALKSRMSWYNIYRNIKLWTRIRLARQRQDLLMMFNDRVIKKIYVYKDVLTVVFSGMIHLYDIEDLSLLANIEGPHLDFQQNDYMIILWREDKKLSIFSKVHSDKEFELRNEFGVEESYMYCLDDDSCYYLNPLNELWVCQWNDRTFKNTFLARHDEKIEAFNVNCGDVYILLSNGTIMKLAVEEKMFMEYVSGLSPESYLKPFYFVNKCDLVCFVPETSNFTFDVQVSKDRLDVGYPILSCIKVHSNMMIFGNTLGKAEIYSRKNLTCSAYPERHIVLKSLQTEDPIVSIDVQESEDVHMVYIATRSSVYKVVYSHDYLKTQQRMMAVPEPQLYDY